MKFNAEIQCLKCSVWFQSMLQISGDDFNRNIFSGYFICPYCKQKILVIIQRNLI